uniref:Uncharacterized protein n=1 Tax=Arundo donax TaxID=35708 RepID=A0A0A8YY38_ARUDO
MCSLLSGKCSYKFIKMLYVHFAKT